MVELFLADTRPPAAEAALVLTAVGIENTLEQTAHGWVVRVPMEDVPRAYEQLQLYWAENSAPTQSPVEAEIVDSGYAGIVAYLLVIWCIPALEYFTQADFRSIGGLHAEAVTRGEWWRAATALTLHADLGHIAANSLFGCLFGLFVGRHLGSGLGWLLVLICGFIANLVNAYVQPDIFRAIGASTATFAALGLVPAFGWRRGFFRGRGFKRGFAPVFGAIALLAFTGFGAENVDAVGHICGFLAGIGMGLAVANINLAARTLADQQRAGVAALILVAAAWAMAFQFG